MKINYEWNVYLRRILALLLIVWMVLSAAFTLQTQAAESTQEDSSELSFLSEKGTRIGVGSGTIQEMLVQENYPDAQIFYYEKFQGYTAVEQGKLDAYIYDKKQMELAVKNGQKGVRILDQTVGDESTRIALGISVQSQIPDLKNQVNQFIARMKADGTLDEMYDRWVNKGNFQMPAIDKASAPDYHLVVATTGDVEPYSFYQGSTITGYDIELMQRFAASINADVEFQIYSWEAIVPALQGGKADIIASNLQMSSEREENFTFSDVLFEEENGVMVRDDLAVSDTAGAESPGALDTSDTSFFGNIQSSFERTFIREDRYKLLLQGIGTTLLITILSILFGTALGFLVYMGCRNGNKPANIITDFFTWLIQGMPVVVLLMILYYIIFAKTSIGGILVAVVAFTLVFGSGVFGMLKSGVGAVDTGQTEAAYALGYGDLKTFFRIILPQAVPHFLPAYKGEIVALLKATAIVGYIAVQDLTKMGDIIRGRTYEAFFPLIAVAVIYFILGGILTFLINRIEIKIDPRRRKREDILKGVSIHD